MKNPINSFILCAFLSVFILIFTIESCTQDSNIQESEVAIDLLLSKDSNSNLDELENIYQSLRDIPSNSVIVTDNPLWRYYEQNKILSYYSEIKDIAEKNGISLYGIYWNQKLNRHIGIGNKLEDCNPSHTDCSVPHGEGCYRSFAYNIGGNLTVICCYVDPNPCKD